MAVIFEPGTGLTSAVTSQKAGRLVLASAGTRCTFVMVVFGKPVAPCNCEQRTSGDPAGVAGASAPAAAPTRPMADANPHTMEIRMTPTPRILVIAPAILDRVEAEGKLLPQYPTVKRPLTCCGRSISSTIATA